MIRDTESKEIHMRLIMAMVNKLMKEGYKVSADHIGYPNGLPPKFNNFLPDIYAIKGKEQIIIEAETCDSLQEEHTRVEWTAFSTKEDINFSIIVPASCVKKAKKLAKQWDIKIKTFWKLED